MPSPPSPPPSCAPPLARRGTASPPTPHPSHPLGGPCAPRERLLAALLGVGGRLPPVVVRARAQRVLGGQRQAVDPVPVAAQDAHQLAVAGVPHADAAHAGGAGGRRGGYQPSFARNVPKAGESQPYVTQEPSRVWVPRTGVSVKFAGAAGPRERAPWARERRQWLFRPCGGLGREQSRYGTAHARLGADLVWGGRRPRLAKCPDCPNRPPAGPIPSWGHQHSLSDPRHLQTTKLDLILSGGTWCVCLRGRPGAGAASQTLQWMMEIQLMWMRCSSLHV